MGKSYWEHFVQTAVPLNVLRPLEQMHVEDKLCKIDSVTTSTIVLNIS